MCWLARQLWQFLERHTDDEPAVVLKATLQPALVALLYAVEGGLVRALRVFGGSLKTWTSQLPPLYSP